MLYLQSKRNKLGEVSADDFKAWNVSRQQSNCGQSGEGSDWAAHITCWWVSVFCMMKCYRQSLCFQSIWLLNFREPTTQSYQIGNWKFNHNIGIRTLILILPKTLIRLKFKIRIFDHFSLWTVITYLLLSFEILQFKKKEELSWNLS